MERLFRNLINSESESFCTGCGACVQKCNKGALSLRQNQQGYYVAHYDPDKCVNCNLCEKVCPILFPHNFAPRAAEPPLFAVQMEDRIRSVSSSGGVFSALAEFILSQGGVVFGASWDEDLTVRHTVIDSLDDLDKLRRSKYVQSYIGDTFRQAKQYLRQKRRVLYTGTPCQIAGLNAFLGKDDPNLLTVDVLCLYAPSQGYFKKYLAEQFPQDKVVACNMRDKRHGWRCSVLSLSLSNGINTYRWDYNDYWEKAFLNRLMMSEHCAKCKFPCHQRHGDLTIGDFWEICNIDKSFDDLGTNSLLVNSVKGQLYFDIIKKKASRCVQKPLNSIKGNRIAVNKYVKPHAQSARFRDLFLKCGFLKSASACIDMHYDIAVLGCWEVRNYGSHLTYYALYQLLKSEGYDIVFVGCPGDAQYKTKGKPEYFKEIPYKEWEMHPQYSNRVEMRDANSLADTFIVGSDQLWEPNLYNHFGRFSFLDFIHSNKRKIAYATSFGRSSWKGTERERTEISFYLKRFNKLSVRELSGVDICKDTFGVDADWNIDPVFLCKAEQYDLLASRSSLDISRREYIAAYILDCTDEKAAYLQKISCELGVELQILVDPNIPHKLSKHLPLLHGFYVEDWIKWIKNSKYVVTDSFHGMCLSIVYKKNFIAYKNDRRGGARFDDYGKVLKVSDRILSSYASVEKALVLLKGIDYSETDSLLATYTSKSREWLKQAILLPVEEALSDFDIDSIRFENWVIESERKAEEKKLYAAIIKLLKRVYRKLRRFYLNKK